MQVLRNLPIKHKLSVIITFITLVVLSVVLVSFIIIDSIDFKRKLFKDLIVQADIIGDNNTANIAFASISPESTKEAITESLASLKANKNIVAAAIYYDSDNKIIATYARDSTEQKTAFPKIFSYTKEPSLIDDEYINIFRPIVLDNDVIGSVYLKADLEELNSRLIKFIIIGFIVLIIGILIAFLISIKIQNVISEPIIQLAEAEKEISIKKDYSIRVNANRNDELGALMRAFNEMLEQIERQNQEVIKAKDLAIESEQAKESFLANMSHEIRTPLNAIIGLSDLLSETEIKPDQKEYLKGISSSGKQLIALVNDILDFSKIQSGKLTFEKIGFKMKELFQEIETTFTFKIKEKNIDFEWNIDDSVPEILLGDPIRLKQVIINLISNAIKFTEKGKVQLDVKSKRKPTRKVELIFKVKDTGIGIPQDKVKSIFESFTQVDSSTSRLYGGTGLGLAICKSLIELQSGTIDLESKEGEGSTFFFELPFMVGKEKDLPMVQKLDSYVHSFENTVILCVDDYHLNQVILSTLLSKMNIEVLLASNGEEALEIAMTNKLDLIFMDIQMPKMDGLKATKEIRKKKNKDQLPIIALTANAVKGEEQSYIIAGMNDFVLKPFRRNDIIQVLQKFLSSPKNSNQIKNEEVIEENKNTSKINLNKLRKLTGNDEALLTQLIDQYKVELIEAKRRLQSMLESKKYGQIEKIAHQIKPAINYLGTESIYNILNELNLKDPETLKNKTQDVVLMIEDIIQQLEKI